jgi:hypothetical protein
MGVKRRRSLTLSTDFDRFFNMFLLRVSVGGLFVVFGLAYLFHQNSIIRFNAFMRDYVFKDTYVLLGSKRIGSLLIMIGFVLLLLAFQLPR